MLLQYECYLYFGNICILYLIQMINMGDMLAKTVGCDKLNVQSYEISESYPHMIIQRWWMKVQECT